MKLTYGFRYKEKLMDILDKVMTIVLVILLCYGVVFLVDVASTEKNCLDAGWADHKVAYDLTSYCIREENEYEIVVPLKDLQNELD